MSLFGDLFDEDEAGNGRSGDRVHGTKTKDLPPPPRLHCGLSGIYNQGATCYLNSLIQTLVMTPEFRDALFSLTADELCESSEDSHRVRKIPLQLQKLFMRLLFLNAQGTSTTQLTDSFGWTNNEELRQHDAQELNRVLFSAIEDSLVGTTGETLIKHLYHGAFVNQIVCMECGRVSEREEDFQDVPLTVAGSNSLHQSLKATFLDKELMCDNNQYRCERCNKLVNAEKGAELRKLPPILTFSLLRFNYDYVKLERYKETGRFEFPLELDMSLYCKNLDTADAQYELFSIVIHRGSTHGGHYHAYIRDIDSLGQWTHPDKEEITLPATPTSGKVDFIEYDSPVELVQAILLRGVKDGMAVDQLCAELVKQTGVSWNKRFKRLHGPINKFLQKFEDKFSLNKSTNMVYLNKDGNHSNEDTQTDTSDRKSENNTNKRERSLTPDPSPGYAWYDYDDSRVRPITLKTIEKQYGGKESAYMLFYRRKSLRRPAAAQGNASYGIPPRLMEEIDKENLELELQRTKHEVAVNTITLSIHFSPFYTYRQGALQAEPGGLTHMDVQIDQRKTIADLKVAIMEVGEDLVPMNFVIHTAKHRPAGLHLYNCVSSNDENVIMHTDIGNHSNLFVWDGNTVCGATVPTGVTNEPLLLNVNLFSGQTICCHGYSKCLTLEALLTRVQGDEMAGNFNCDNITVFRTQTKGTDTESILIPADSYSCTLEVLKLQDRDTIIIEDASHAKNSSVIKQAVEGRNKLLQLQVENRLTPCTDDVSPVIPVDLESDMTIEELKSIVLSQIPGCTHTVDQCRLRVDHDSYGLRPPLHEGQTLEDAGLKTGSRLVLEAGIPPSSSQITLTFTPGNVTSDLPDLEVMVERSLTVGECLSNMLLLANLDGKAWHLRKTNWCREAAGVLDDLDMSLEDNQIRDGDHLLLEAGALPPKGYVNVHAWLYTCDHGNTNSDEGIISWIAHSMQGLLSTKHTSPSDGSVRIPQTPGSPLGEIQISKQSTVEDLKNQIMTLEGMEQVTVPTPDFIRLQLIEEGRLSTVFKENNQTLQKLKITSSSHIAVQPLQQEEHLSAHHIILSIHQRVTETRSYLPPVEIKWDTSKSGATLSSLRQTIADVIMVPEDRLAVAKHLHNKYEWLEIKEGGGQKSQKQSKGKKKQKSNLRHAPYHISDGDTIGVKDRQFDPFSKDDFSTADDDAGRQRLREEAEEKKRMREESKRRNIEACGGSGDSKYKRREEVGIKIHVGDFR